MVKAAGVALLSTLAVSAPASAAGDRVSHQNGASGSNAPVPSGSVRGQGEGHLQISGVYPHLAFFNREKECGTGAVVPWAGSLWAITYGPHRPFGSSDKLYQITEDLDLIVREESVGGTPANRMIHRESGQLLIGPYLIDEERNVRLIPPAAMPGRLTGTARHLTEPESKVYYATMEEGLYEVDVNTLEVRGLIADGNVDRKGRTRQTHPVQVKSELPGYHGKGLYSGQGKLIYSNNGERDKRVATDPTIPSGALAEWDTPGEDWKLIRRNQFTEVSGPGGIFGNENPETDPVWSVGWDDRSLILMVLHEGEWHSYRLPKGSHSYDGSHGWNTEWPRIREIGSGNDFLMTMHGTFWHFPGGFTPENSSGIAPRSNHLRVTGDFAFWKGRIVFGCNDTAASEFFNVKRRAKGEAASAGQSQSNLWFVQEEQLDRFGPAIGRGALWKNDDVKAGVASEPYLFSGYDLRSLHLTHASPAAVNFSLEVDIKGDGNWTLLKDVEVPANGSRWLAFTSEEKGAWVRLTPKADALKATAFFHYRNRDDRTTEADSIFCGIAKPGEANVTGGLLHVRGEDLRTLRLLLTDGFLYDTDVNLTPMPVDDPDNAQWQAEKLAIPLGVVEVDAASALYVDENGSRWRFPKGDSAFDGEEVLGAERISREVATERDLLNLHGTFYELPAENAGGFSKVRPVATHNLRIKDYASYRGLVFLSGISAEAPTDNDRIRRSTDGKTALWVGVIDDLWKAGKPRGEGGPWADSVVSADVPSDAYLMTGYDRKSVKMSHKNDKKISITLQTDITGADDWVSYQTFEIPSGETVEHVFPEAFSAYWVRAVADQDTTATVQFKYE